MMDPELRVQLILWFSQSWPIRAVSWLLEKGVPEHEGFGKFRARHSRLTFGGAPLKQATEAEIREVMQKDFEAGKRERPDVTKAGEDS